MAERCRVCGEEACLTHCVYCGADCDLPEPDHADDCPSTTGVFPVRRKDVMCPGCGRTELGMRCSECGGEFKVGEHYTHRETAPDVREPLCLGCAAQAALA